MGLLKFWKWSLGVAVRSPAVLLLAALAALWAYGAYRWLWLPESSAFMLLLALVWAIVQVLVAASVAAGTALDSAEAAAIEGLPSDARRAQEDAQTKRFFGVTFKGKLVGQTVLMLAATTPLVLLLALLFHWVNAHALEVASFLTFHASKPVSYHLLEKIFWWLEAIVWTAVSGFLLSVLRVGLHAGWREAWGGSRRTLVKCCFGRSLLTSLVSVGVFGGLAVLLATWHVKAAPGRLDYFQLVVRMGLALLLLAAGWLFWMLSLARLGRD